MGIFDGMFSTTLAVLGAVLAVNAGAQGGQRVPPVVAQRSQPAINIMEEGLRRIDPDLLQKAIAKGIYKYEEYPVFRAMNPFWLRGDFNGDGAMDIAVWVTQASSGRKGVAVIHSTLDTVRYLGAGTDMPRAPGNAEIGVDAWHVIPAGYTMGAVRETVPEVGAVDGQPFTFQRETLRFVNISRSSFVFYWNNGRYVHIGTGD